MANTGQDYKITFMSQTMRDGLGLFVSKLAGNSVFLPLTWILAKHHILSASGALLCVQCSLSPGVLLLEDVLDCLSQCEGFSCPIGTDDKNRRQLYGEWGGDSQNSLFLLRVQPRVQLLIPLSVQKEATEVKTGALTIHCQAEIKWGTISKVLKKRKSLYRAAVWIMSLRHMK